MLRKRASRNETMGKQTKESLIDQGTGAVALE